MMLHIDGSDHRWFQDDRWYDLIVILDDATSEILTQVGRAMKELGIRMTPAYSPQARGRSERGFGTWQGRLPQELRLRQITTLEGANTFLRQSYIAEFNEKFARPAAEKGTAFVPLQRPNLNRIFSIQHERIVNKAILCDGQTCSCRSNLPACDRRWQT